MCPANLSGVPDGAKGRTASSICRCSSANCPPVSPMPAQITRGFCTFGKKPIPCATICRAGRPEQTCDTDCSSAATCSDGRSEEHTSELQSHHELVCRLLLE